ncbi:MAG TPA: cytochrome o ubiquinol oxidase subunit IV [Rhizomicrobium sp.]|jgi:cytochrome o ubiquinol oxidase operon protein cyoD|nr:cytochrome o ubiquinol oxidase subunit IV [Rhizomicrobium sp.]
MTTDSERADEGDDLGGDSEAHVAKVSTYLIGLALAVLLTAASFWAVNTHLIYGPGIPVALATLAVAQMGIHLVFFLHLTTAPDNLNNALALAFGLLIVGLIVFGSVWIMAHMNYNLMAMTHPM